MLVVVRIPVAGVKLSASGPRVAARIVDELSL